MTADEQTEERIEHSLWITVGWFAMAIASSFLAENWPALHWATASLTLMYLSRLSGWFGALLFIVSSTVVIAKLTTGVIPIPDAERYVLVAIIAIMGYLPYGLQLFTKNHLPGWLSTLVLPSAVVVLDFAGSSGPFGTFGAIAYSQFEFLPLVQLASVTGIWGITFLVYWFGATIWWAFGRDGTLSFCNRKESICLSMSVLTVAAVIFYGYQRLNGQITSGGSVIKVACVASPTGPTPFDAVRDMANAKETLETGAASGVDDADAESRLSDGREAVLLQLNKLLPQTEDLAADGAKLIVWSEAALVTPSEMESEVIGRCETVARETNSTLIIALGTWQSDAALFENKTVLIDASGTVIGSYLKSRLVPGEPCVQGNGEVLLASTKTCGDIASLICFDADFPVLVRQVSTSDSFECQILTNSANDWPEIEDIQLEMSAFRSIENGIWMVRSTSYGKSAIISPFGEVIFESSTIDGEPVLLGKIETSTINTIYARSGDAFAKSCLALLPALLVTSVVVAVRKRSSQKNQNLEVESNG
ncbi:MAG: nitrilase-related carbon-nitrogen hydrolase [Pirellulaceae bacterium]